MFIIGVLIGPVVGVLAGDYLFRPGGPGRWGAIGAIVLLGLAIVFLPIFKPELKCGLVLGLVAGSLLASTPMSVFAGEDEVLEGQAAAPSR